MRKVKVGFREQSKAVTAEVDIEYSGENNDKPTADILREAQELYDEASKFSKMKTMQKL